MEENPTFSGQVVRAQQVSSLRYSPAEMITSAGLADLYDENQTVKSNMFVQPFSIAFPHYHGPN